MVAHGYDTSLSDDGTWLRYTIGIMVLAYLMVHGVWHDMVDVHGTISRYMVDAWYRLVHGMVHAHILCQYVCFSTLLVEACVDDGGHLVKRCPWHMIRVRGSSVKLAMEPIVFEE
jgi:hypothetical protein